MKVPKRGKKFLAVVQEGCIGTKVWTDWGYEYDCEYEWDCDYCPVVISNERAKGE